MSDLISRSRAIENIWDVFNSYANNSLRFGKYETEAINNAFTVLQKVIEGQQTAYDVEKVVEELEEEKEISCADFTKYVNEYNPCLDDECDDFFHKGLERAIAITGKGGVE